MAVRQFHLYGTTRAGVSLDLGYRAGTKSDVSRALSYDRKRHDLVIGEAWEVHTTPDSVGERREVLKEWK